MQGVLPVALACREAGRRLILPRANATEAFLLRNTGGADGRFVLGDMITLGAAPGWTVIVKQVGLLQTLTLAPTLTLT